MDGSYEDSELEISGFKSYRRNRDSGRGGGITMYASKLLKSMRRQDLEDGGMEVLWIQVNTRRGNKLRYSET